MFVLVLRYNFERDDFSGFVPAPEDAFVNTIDSGEFWEAKPKANASSDIADD